MSIGILLIILNINNIKKLNSKVYFYDSYKLSYENFTQSYNKLNNKIKFIRNKQGIYKDNDYKEILDNINMVYENVNNLRLIKYYSNYDYIKQIDINLIANNMKDFTKYSLIINNFIKILSKYDYEFSNKKDALLKTYNDVYITESYLSYVSYNPLFFYYYSLESKVYEIDDINYNLSNYKLNSIISSYIYNIDVYNYLIDYIIEVDDISYDVKILNITYLLQNIKYFIVMIVVLIIYRKVCK